MASRQHELGLGETYSAIPATVPHLADVSRIQQASYPDHLLEDEASFLSKLTLCPQGCFVLVHTSTKAVVGYVFSYPAEFGKVSQLNSKLSTSTTTNTCHYIHDMCVHPNFRHFGGSKLLWQAVLNFAQQYTNHITLISITPQSHSFWRKLGFEDASLSLTTPEQVVAYGTSAMYMCLSLN